MTLKNSQKSVITNLPNAKMYLMGWHGYVAVKLDKSKMGYLAFCPDRKKWEFVPYEIIKRERIAHKKRMKNDL